MLKSVDAKKYDTDYFESVLSHVDYTKKVTTSDFKSIHQTIALLVKHTSTDLVVDFGCGNGDLAFLLAMKYKCRVIGIDYSKNAIDIAKKNANSLVKSKSLPADRVTFMCATNENLPRLKNISAVYLADVIEHLYDEEIDYVINAFKKWNQKNLIIAIHTDNNNYLRIIRPFIDALSILTGKETWRNVQKRNQWERERHVNLTTQQKLINKMATYNFRVLVEKKPTITHEMIKSQLGNLGSNMGLVKVVTKITSLFSFLLPSFYIAFQLNES